MRNRQRRLKTKYILAISAIVAVLLAFVLTMLWYTNFLIRDTEKERIIEDVRLIGANRSNNVNDLWQSHIVSMETVAAIVARVGEGGIFKEDLTPGESDGQSVDVKFTPRDNIEDILEQYLNERTMDFAGIANADGFLYLIARDNSRSLPVNISDRSYFQLSRNGFPAISDLLVSKISGNSVNIISVPVIIDGKVEAVIINAFYTDTLTRLLESKETYNEHIHSYIINQDYTAVTTFHEDVYQQRISEHIRWADINSADPGNPRSAQNAEFEDGYLSIELDDKTFYACVNTLSNDFMPEGKQWRLVTIIPEEDVSAYAVQYADVVGILAFSLSVAVIACFLLVLLLIRYAKKEQEGEIYKYRSALNLFNEYSFEYATETDKIFFSDASRRMLCLNKSEYTLRELLMEEYIDFNDYEKLRRITDKRLEETKLTVKSGKLELFLEIKFYPVKKDDSAAKVDFYIGIIEDITDTVNKHNELKIKAQTDSLTQSYNRETAVEMIDDYMKAAKNVRCALFLMDIDEFKQINDKYGHFVGDTLLTKISAVIRSVYPDENDAVIGRLGGDEFCVFVKKIPHSADVHKIAKTLCDKISSVPITGDESNFVSCSIGVAIFPRHGVDFAALYQCADNALYKSKEELGSCYTVYNHLDGGAARSYHSSDPDGVPNVEDNLSLLLTSADGEGKEKLLQIMNSALDNEEFVLYKQAKVSTSGRPPQAECLVRWDSPKYGLLMPNKFIPIFEKAGIMERFDLYILEKGIMECSGERARVKLSVNQSLQTIAAPYYLNKVKEFLDKYPYKKGYLTIEITERGLYTGMRTLVKIINKLHELGFRISIDDFGSGFTTLNILKDLDIDEIKIDRTFIDINDNYRERARIITLSVCKMAKLLGIKTVAEGVETLEQADALAKYGCDYLQGFYFGRAEPDDVFSEKFEKGEYVYPKKDA